MRYPAHTTTAANEQRSSSSFGLMIRLLLVLSFLLFHSGAMAGGTPPTISLVTILTTYLEGSGTETLASDVTLAAGDSGDIASATITINSGYQSLEDVLAFPDANGITGSWDGGSGILTLSTSTPLPSISTWEQALESVTYQNNTDNPNTSDRAFVIEIEDEGGFQASDGASFSVTAVNDAPTISSATGSTVTEDIETAGTEVGNISASDVDDTFLTYSITNGDPNIFFSIDSFGVITLTTLGENALYEDNLVTTTYTLEITVSDDELASTTANVDIIFQAVNDPPSLSLGDTISIDEGATHILTSSEIVVLDEDDNLSDVNIAISNLSSSLSIQVEGSPVTSFTAQQLTDGNVSLVHDGSEPTSDSFDLTPEDGDEDVSSPTPVSFSVAVSEVNDAPTISSATGSTVTEDIETAGTEVGNISASDVDDTFLTYSITNGDPNIFFSIDSFGVITLTTLGENALYEDNLVTTTYTLEITVSDDELASTTANVDIIFQAVNDPPALADAGDVLSFIEDSAATIIDGSLTLSDADNTDLASATVQISSGFIATEDVLGFTDANGITHTWDSGTGVLTLSGTSSVTNYEAALESVTYQNTNTTNPNKGDRVVSWTVSDGSLSSTAATSTITITDQNDPASFSGDLFVETQGLNALSGTISATDPDIAPSSGTFSITGSPGQGSLTGDGIGPSTGTYTYEQTGTNLQLAGSDSFTVSYDDGVFGSTSQTIVINYNAEPVINSTSGSTVSYGSGNTTSIVASIDATDGDDSELTYSITGGDFDSYFTIDSSTGDIRLNAAGASAVNSTSFTTISYALVVRVQDDAAPNPAFDTSSVDVTLEGQQVYVRFRASTSAGVGATAVGAEPSPGLGTEFWGCLQYEPSVTQNAVTSGDFGNGDGYFDPGEGVANNLALRMKAYSNTGRYVETDTNLFADREFIKYDSGQLRFFASQLQTVGGQYQSFYVLDTGYSGTGVPTSWSSVSANAYLGIGFGPENVPNQTGTGQSWVYPKITEWVVESTPCYIGVDDNNDLVLDEDDLLSSNADLLFNNFFGGDTAAVTDEDTPATGVLVGIDEDGLDATQPFSITGTGPANGTATISNTDSTATWQYTPNANYFGTDSFTVRFTDGLGNSQNQLVTITVNSVNDIPSATTDFFTVKEDSELTGAVSSNDVESGDGGNTYTNTSEPTSGSLLTFDNGSGTFTYAPNADFYGTDSFTYELEDSDGDVSTSTVTITVDDVPDAVDDAFSTNEDTPLTADVSQNDVPSVDGTNTYGVVTGVGQGPNHGSLSWNNDGSFVYTPDANFSGSDTFDYVLSDTDGDQSTGTVSITIISVDDAPVAESKSLTVDEDSPGTNLGLLTPTTPDTGETLTVTVTQVPGTGEGIVSNAGTPLAATDTITPSELAGLTFTPNSNYDGTVAAFIYTVSDGTGSDDSTGAVTITITPIDDAPVAESKSLTVDEDSPGTNLGLLTPTTPDTGETLTVTVTQVPGTGEGIVSNAGTPLAATDTITPSELAGLTFTPNSNYDGTVAAFIYKVSDGTGSDDGTVTIAITPQNDSPVGVDDAFNTVEDTPLAGDVSINDTPGDGQNTYSIVSTEAPNHGTLALNSNGSFDYEPDLNFVGTDTFGYQFSDADGESANATVTINVLDSQLDDDDGDGVIDSADAYPNVSLNGLADLDNDGAPDVCDATCVGLGMQADIFPNDANEWLDHDNDGIGDNADLDDDNDGLTDSTDLYPFDSDNDGTDNSFDTDDDNDGILDEDDTYPLISILGYFPDSDSDGAPNNCDSVCLATGMQADADDDNDGVADVADDLPLNELAATDSDGDGYADEYLPSSIAFLGEAGLDIEDLFLDRTIYALDAFPSNQSEWRDADGDGTGDNADVDDDNDGVSDALDLLPEDANWNTAATPTTAVGTQLIARYKGALANPSINFTDPRNGATIELTGSQSGQFINDLGSTAFVWQTDVEGWLAFQADLTDLTHAIPFDIPVSGLRDLVTDGLINTLALDSSYGANLFTVQEVVAELRLIKVGDEPGVTETYAMETTYGYYIENAALRAQVLTEMLIQQPDRVDQARELILGFTSLEAVSFIRGDLASSSPILQDGLPFGGTQTLSILPSELASVSSFSTLELDQFPVVPEALLPAPYDFGADVDTQVALFSASGQGTLEGDPSCALSWTASASTLELTVTQVPNASTCISLGDVHSITPIFFDETSETLLYVRSSIGSETHTRLMLDRRDVLGPNLDASAIASLLTSEQVLVSGEQLVDPTDYIGDGLDGFIIDIGDIDALVLKNDGTISADNLPVDGTARYVSSVTPGAVQSEDWQWILTTQGIEFDDPATSATSTIDPVSGQLTTIPDVHWRILELDEDNRLWVIETEIIPSTPYTESRLNFYTVLNQDQDGDLEADLDEVIANTDPFTFNDADGDGLSDFDESNNTGTNPTVADTDGDGVADGIDADPLESSMSGVDSNFDGIDDAWATTYYSGALNPNEDLDGDSLTVRDEYVSGTLDTFFNERQIITAPEPRLRLNRASRIPVRYSVSDNSQTLPGLGLRIHFHGDAFSLFKLDASTPYLNGLVEIDNVWKPDTNNLDANFFTDHYIEVKWNDATGNWPGEGLPVTLGQLLVAPNPATSSGEAIVDFSASSLAPNYGLDAAELTLRFGRGNSFDIDEDGKVTPLSDGLMMVRFLFGFTTGYERLISANSPHANDPSAIIDRLNEHLPMMDIDDDGNTAALSDGLLLIRYLFGFRGDALVSNAVGQGANRGDAATIEAHLNEMITQ